MVPAIRGAVRLYRHPMPAACLSFCLERHLIYPFIIAVLILPRYCREYGLCPSWRQTHAPVLLPGLFN